MHSWPSLKQEDRSLPTTYFVRVFSPVNKQLTWMPQWVVHMHNPIILASSTPSSIAVLACAYIVLGRFDCLPVPHPATPSHTVPLRPTFHLVPPFWEPNEIIQMFWIPPFIVFSEKHLSYRLGLVVSLQTNSWDNSCSITSSQLLHIYIIIITWELFVLLYYIYHTYVYLHKSIGIICILQVSKLVKQQDLHRVST